MKIICGRSVLLDAVSTASRAVAQKSPYAALEGLLFEAGSDRLVITGYNMKIGIRTVLEADIPESGRLVLNARLLAEILRKMPEGDVVLATREGNLVTLTCGMSYFEIIATDADEFPELPSVEEESSIRVPEKILKSMIAETVFAVSVSETRPVQTGSLFRLKEGLLTVVSVDGYRLALRREKLEGQDALDLKFVVPGTALSEVERAAGDSDDEMKISLGSRHILFLVGSTEIISRRLEGEFLDYEKSIPTTQKYDLLADRQTLLSVFERVSLMISEKYKSPVRCRFERDCLRISAATAIGKATDECVLEGDAEGLEVGFNNRYVLDALHAVTADKLRIRLTSAVSPCVFAPEDPEDDSFLYLVLPVRIRAEE